MADKKRPSSTAAVHGGEPRHFPCDALTAPIVQTATYSFENTAELVSYMEGRADRQEYGRYGNPTVDLLEERVAHLEGATSAVAFGSGMAAVTSTILALVKRDAHVVLFSDCYRRTRQFVTGFLSNFGVEHTLVPPADMTALEAALRPETKLVISEAPTNPYLTVPDFEKLAAICAPKRVRTLIDSTIATPINLRPLEYGIDLVVHSATKYLGGHNDVLAGVLTGKPGLVSLVRDVRHMTGAMCDPHAAYLVHRGIKTLSLRIAHQNSSAMAIAEFLEGHPKVEQVWYPGLVSHPCHDVAVRTMDGFGGMVTFCVRADLNGTGRFIDALEIPKIAPSMGGTESLVEQPALMSFFELSTAQREAVGIKNNLVRYSVGIESTEDLIADLRSALEAL
ncbi:MAG: aminotransferase class I/II-fold pyridoxal phosphate-dependent enzyme [Myxococcales bacterium]|nr:aminotransferase class I/II-fold pyridoxal phosphate-dependent enzyme [Myxococcales bacterium]MDD9970559.1 aminotransferase class I/II-fold pyridoxal phosphate-dependent enzyme [Myxococcales bacterium]